MTHARISSPRLDIDLPLPDGITALLGPAGAGKTAALGAIAFSEQSSSAGAAGFNKQRKLERLEQ